MITLRHQNRRGFSLVELSIVLGVAGVIFGALWSFAASARQNTHLQQAKEYLNLTVDAVRNAYSPQVNITGDVSTVIPYLIQGGNLAPPIIRAVASTCNSISSYYADTPWQGIFDVCGTLRLCAWSYGTNTQCNAPTASGGAQYFSVEFQQLDFGTCVALAQRAVPTAPPGLRDVYINGNSAVSAATVLPVLPALAQNRAPYVGKGCLNTNTNVLDFVYTLRAPAY